MSRDIAELEPVTRALCEQFLKDCADAGLNVRVTQTRRTLDEQAALWAQGRTAPGRIVTRSKPGESAHNYGAAFDIAEGDSTPYETAPDFWLRCGEIGERLGLAWGGRWQHFKDLPHFERRDWMALRAGVRG